MLRPKMSSWISHLAKSFEFLQNGLTKHANSYDYI